MPTWDRKALHDLNVLLATLYPTVEDSRRVVSAAGLRHIQIAFNNQALTNWFNILDHAEQREKVGDVIDAALADEPDNQSLLSAKAGAPPRVVEGPEPADWHGESDESTLEKIIGARSTLVPVRYLELGVEKAKSVVRVVHPGGATGSGFLVEDNILITNNHVIESTDTAANTKIQFNFQKTVTGLDALVEEAALMPDRFFKTSKEHDWTAVAVEGNPVAKWGALELARANPEIGEHVNIIQHPGGGQKQISVAANVIVFVDENRVQYLTDTLPGSSGSPVFDDKWAVVALHHSGGWLSEPKAASKTTYYRNEGININRLVAELN